MIILFRGLLLAFVLCTANLAVQAQTTQRIRGTIAVHEAGSITVTTREGPVVSIKLNDPLAVFTVKRLPLSAIAAGTYIGTAAVPGADAMLTALEVYVFPETSRGTAEGHGPWDLAPNSSMTNATISAVVADNAGEVLTLTYKGESVRVRVPATAPIVTTVPGTADDLKPGERIFIFAATRAADGTLSAGRITVSKDGVAPPM